MKKNNTRLLVIPLILSALWSCSVLHRSYKPGDTLILQPGPKEGIDAYIENWSGENYPNRNWGGYDAFAASAWTAKGSELTVRCLMKFDLHKITPGTRIRKAALSLYAVSTPGIGSGHSAMSGPNDFLLMKVTSPWDEYKVTWNTQPSVTDENEVRLPGTTSELKDYENIDLTAMVQEMIDNPTENYGIMIRLAEESYYRRVIFGSSDNAVSRKRPKLVIDF